MKLPRIDNEDDYRRWCRGQLFEASLCLFAVLVITALFVWGVASGGVP